jgi:hypothetical protein
MEKRTIFVDFDGTICPNKNGDEYAPPSDYCILTLKKLQKAGHWIVIYSVRSNLKETNKPGGHDEMKAYLSKYNVPYDDIEDSKVHFSLLIDDKTLGIPKDKKGNVKWKQVRKLLKGKYL